MVSRPGRNYSKRVAVMAVLPRTRLNVAVTAPRARSRLRPKAVKYSGAGKGQAGDCNRDEHAEVGEHGRGQNAGHLDHRYDSGEPCAQHGQRTSPGCYPPFPARVSTLKSKTDGVHWPARRRGEAADVRQQTPRRRTLA